MILLFATATALAGVPVVFDGGDAREVVAFVAGRTGLPVDQLDGTPLDGLLSATPRTLGDAVMRHCAGSATKAADLRAEAVRAEAAWRDGDADAAMDRLDLAIAGLGCLGERVEAPVAARMFLLRGGLMAHQGHADDAVAELVTGISLDPSAAWDEGLPGEGLPTFTMVKTEPASAKLAVAPSSSPAAPAVDGRAVSETLSLRPGLHLVQIPSTAGLRTAWLTLDGDATLVVPTSYRRPILPLMADDARRGEIEALLMATLATPAAYVVADGGLWLVSVEEGVPVTTMLVEPPPPPPPEEPKRWWQR